MLHWLAGQKGHDNNAGMTMYGTRESDEALLINHANTDPDATGYVEPPETPAPVFAVRAFKHAIFGTPQTVQQPRHPRRHSNTETTRPKTSTRPRIDRPKSSNDTHTVGKLGNAVEEEPQPSSPTKGILLTPGTATARRKTVSFGDNVVDNEGKRPMKSGLPDDCPGKYPSPWSKPTADANNVEGSLEKPRGRSKLTEQLEQVREESQKRKSKSGKPGKGNEDGDLTMDFAEPRSESGKYWKQEYDIYRENTTREVRKLVEKRKQAKRYAQEKDTENTELKAQLRQERKNVETLEKRMAELEGQMKEFQSQLSRDRHAKTAAKEEPAEKPARPERRSWKSEAVQQSHDLPQDPAATAAWAAASNLSKGNTESSESAQDSVHPKARRPRLRNIQTKTADDLWAQNFSSSIVDSNKAEPPTSKSPTRAGADETEPLKSKNINTLADETRGVAMSMGLQPPSPQREKRQDSPMRSPGLSPRSPELPAKVQERAKFEPLKRKEENAALIPDSSPFQPDAATERPNVLTGAPVPIKPSLRPTTRPVDTKENVSPRLRPSQPRSPENHKPSDAWNAMSVHTEQQRNVSLCNGDTSRAERAKARLAARGRDVS